MEKQLELVYLGSRVETTCIGNSLKSRRVAPVKTLSSRGGLLTFLPVLGTLYLLLDCFCLLDMRFVPSLTVACYVMIS